MGILANKSHFVKSKVVYKNRYTDFTNRSLSPQGLWYNIATTERGWGKPMPGEYSWMMERRTRDTSPGPSRICGNDTSAYEESPDQGPGFDFSFRVGATLAVVPNHMRALSSSVNLPLVETMALSPSSGGGPPQTLTTSPPASRRISQPAAMSQGLVPNSNCPSARPQAM